jgi:hypothetical protein
MQHAFHTAVWWFHASGGFINKLHEQLILFKSVLCYIKLIREYKLVALLDGKAIQSRNDLRFRISYCYSIFV